MPPITHIEPGDDSIRILLTTDNHVGYSENDPIRTDDAWQTFHEITLLARHLDVDAIVQGGDLFHINKPLKKSLYHVIRSLRQNCMGDRPCELELLSDPSSALDSYDGGINYEDPNLNISVPVFAINGNHDDATGDGLLSPLDILSATGLVNYFGKIRNNEDITVTPLLFQKGTTKLALYGMANVRDERLHRAFRDGLVKFQRPDIHTDHWFNLFCIHQNHAQHTYTSSIPEHFLPRFLDFVLWGHEHECVPNPVHNPETGFDVLQAGSSVATSLSEGEVADKYCFVLTVKNRQYSIEPIRLKSVRPFVLKEIMLADSGVMPGPASRHDVVLFLTDIVEDAIQEANDTYVRNNPDLFERDPDESTNCPIPPIPLPLIRIRVDYSGGYEIENTRRFSNKFVGRIANVNDAVHFYKKRVYSSERALVSKTKFVDTEDDPANPKPTEAQLSDLLADFLGQAELTLIPEAGISDAVKLLVDNDDKNVLEQYIKQEIKKETKVLLDLDIDSDEMHGANNKARDIFKQVINQVKRENKVRASVKTKPIALAKDSVADIPQSDEEETYTPPKGATKKVPARPARNTKKPIYAEPIEVILSDEE